LVFGPARVWEEADKRLKRQLQVGGTKDFIDEMIERLWKKEGIETEELRNGGKRWKVSQVRGRIAYQLNHEMGSHWRDNEIRGVLHFSRSQVH
jgi:hypothetical protein